MIVIARFSVPEPDRALGSHDAKMTVAPLLSMAIDEPSAYESLENLRLGPGP